MAKSTYNWQINDMSNLCSDLFLILIKKKNQEQLLRVHYYLCIFPFPVHSVHLSSGFSELAEVFFLDLDDWDER